ncbi:Ankyrin repeat-containing protein [Cynara cardunculus var. scolymus]|uniref:Ankyrin repeat-containing protein n=1 Tax=Cynara cardunculus var. scolymus TaxID=59895 RepID=A0A103XDG3_CYNCS|nr:Ankyrin repeat-containing protein [Cynara cardunculus var. scolymus]
MESTPNSERSVEMVDSSARIEDLKYLSASNVNVSNFVSVKLSGESNYGVWKSQMLCLMETRKMRGIVDPKFDGPDATDVETLKQYDSLLKGWIFGSVSEHVLRTVVNLGSAIAVWKKLQLVFDHDDSFPQDSDLLEQFTLTEISTVTQAENIDDIQLRKATVEGRWWRAEAILKNAKMAATEAISNDGNTMLHLAVELGQNDFVKKLLDFIDDGNEIEKQNLDGRTALHIAAIVGNTYAAELLVKKRKELLGISDHKTHVPLLSAYYNMQLNTFIYLLEATEIKHCVHSRLHPGVNLLITAIFTKQYDLASKLAKVYPELATNDDQVLMAMVKTFPSELGFREALIYPSSNKVQREIVKTSSSLFYSYEFSFARAKDILWEIRRFKSTYHSWYFPEIAAMFYPIYQMIRLLVLVLLYPFFVLYFLLWKLLANIVPPIKRIETKKKDYEEANFLLNLVCDEIDKLNFSGRCYRRPIIEAACHGVYEVVDEILFRSPKAIGFTNRNGHNIIQLAIINRSEKIYNLIRHTIKRKDFYRKIMDSSKNNILHLAGRLAPSFVLSRTTGAALQLQRELQWRKEVEKLMLPTDLIKENIDMETPEMVFTREHDHLVKEGEKWMKTTAESCSITAALITTIVFAAAITVPGGSNQETGIPLFRKEIAFTIFAVSDAISLFASSTALLVFLSILTTRFSEQDFLVSLPRRLIIGFFVLFLSTSAMMVAFCAVLFLVFCDQRAWMVAPIGVLACLPITAVVTLQFPLVVELFLSTYFSFGKQNYIDRCKSNLNNMQSFFDRLGIEHES